MSITCTKELSIEIGECDFETCSTKSRLSAGAEHPILMAYAPDLCYCLVLMWDAAYANLKFYKYEPLTNTLTLKATRVAIDIPSIVYNAKQQVFVMVDGFANPDIVEFDPVTETLAEFPSQINGYGHSLIYVPSLETVYGQLGLDGTGLTYIGSIDTTLLKAAEGTIGAVHTALAGDTVSVGANTYTQGVDFTDAASLAIAITLDGIVNAIDSGNSVLLEAVNPGSAGNSITLVLGGGNLGAMTISGATLQNGADAYILLGTIPASGASKPRAYSNIIYSPISNCLYGPWITAFGSGVIRFNLTANTGSNILTAVPLDATVCCWDSDRNLMTLHGGAFALANVWEVDTSSDTIVNTVSVTPNAVLFDATYVSSLQKVIGAGWDALGDAIISYDTVTGIGTSEFNDFDYDHTINFQNGSFLATAEDTAPGGTEGIRRVCIT